MKLYVENKYHLNLQFPVDVEDSDGVAKFDKDKEELQVILPIKQTSQSTSVLNSCQAENELPRNESADFESETGRSNSASKGQNETCDLDLECLKPPEKVQKSCSGNSVVTENKVEQEGNLTENEIKWMKVHAQTRVNSSPDSSDIKSSVCRENSTQSSSSLSADLSAPSQCRPSRVDKVAEPKILIEDLLTID